jgi:hypothetical protein
MFSEFDVMLSQGILQNRLKLCETWGSHSGVEENSSPLEYDAVYIGILLLTLLTSFLPTYSRLPTSSCEKSVTT